MCTCYILALCSHYNYIYFIKLTLIFGHTGKTKDKPEVIKDYNDHMLGVDHLDKKGLLFIPSQICKVVAECVLFLGYWRQQ